MKTIFKCCDIFGYLAVGWVCGRLYQKIKTDYKKLVKKEESW